MGLLVKTLKAKENFTDNGGYNILRLFDILPNFPFTTSETGNIITKKNSMYELPLKMLNKLRLIKLLKFIA